MRFTGSCIAAQMSLGMRLRYPLAGHVALAGARRFGRA